MALPKERERVLTKTDSEIRFVINNELKANLEKVRSLLGTKALKMSFAELVFEMSQLSIQSLSEKVFGKRRAAVLLSTSKRLCFSDQMPEDGVSPTNSGRKIKSVKDEKQRVSSRVAVSKSLRYQVWIRDQGKCTKCESRINLNIDHIRPQALGDNNDLDNLRLLCFHCNQRHAFKTFGIWESGGTSSLRGRKS